MKIYKEVFLAPDTADATWHRDRAEWQSRGTLHVHGCSPWGCEPDEWLTELSRRYLKGSIGRRSRAQGGAADVDGGVLDDEYQDVQQSIFHFLGDVGFTAHNPTPQAEGILISEEARGRGLRDLARDMRGFDWSDEGACRDRYANLLNASQRHTRCGKCFLKNGSCRFGFPNPRNDNFTIRAHPLVSPPTEWIDDWQVIVTPPNASPPDEGEEGPGPCDEYVNRHCDWQLLGWGGNVDCSPIVDHGSAHRYMVKYASKGEARSREAQSQPGLCPLPPH